MNYKLITIPLSDDEQRVLRIAANQECRRPRDHARYILLNALGIPTTNTRTPVLEKHNSDGIRQDQLVAALS